MLTLKFSFLTSTLVTGQEKGAVFWFKIYFLDHYDLWTDKKWSMRYDRHRLNNLPHVAAAVLHVNLGWGITNASIFLYPEIKCISTL